MIFKTLVYKIAPRLVAKRPQENNLFHIVRIECEDDPIFQPFIRFSKGSSRHARCLNIVDIIKNDRPSLVAYTDNDAILKLIKPRRFHEIIKTLWLRNRLFKEVKGNRLLKALGITTPEINDIGYGLLSRKQAKFLGYILMQNLYHSGYQDCEQLLKDNDSDSIPRQTMMKHLLIDIKKMLDNNIVFSDLALGNILCRDDGSIAWVDTGVTQYSSLSKKRVRRKFTYSIKRFININEAVFEESEKLALKSLV